MSPERSRVTEHYQSVGAASPQGGRTDRHDASRQTRNRFRNGRRRLRQLPARGSHPSRVGRVSADGHQIHRSGRPAHRLCRDAFERGLTRTRPHIFHLPSVLRVRPRICATESGTREDVQPIADQRGESRPDHRHHEPYLERIWHQFEPSANAIAIVLSDRRHPAATGSGPSVLGDTIFTSGHATPYFHLWMGNAEALAGGSEIGGPPFIIRSREERNAIVLQMMGVALACNMSR